MYGIRGETLLKEKTLDHLSGYLGSKPVRIGNDAYLQSQNDVYGVLLDVIFKSLKYLDYRYDALEDLWTIVRTLVRTVAGVWREPDSGIWEFRGQKRHFVFSKVMCWTALDRGMRIATRLGMTEYVERWTTLCDEIKEDIYKNGWNSEVGAFVQSYESDQLDASNLLMEYYGFIEAGDPRYVATVMKSKEQLCENGLMYRYRAADDFGAPSSSFTVCTFWLVYSLHRIGMQEEARAIFDDVLAKRNSLGLLSEDISFKTGRLLGNFPQAYSHLALITCASLISGTSKTPLPSFMDPVTLEM
jgi:GH15 family glucan-1,4-alpha-glucosidase